MQKYFVTVLYGSDNYKKFWAEEPFEKSDLETKLKTYYFDTQIELDAFILGLNEASGWLETVILENVEKLPIDSEPISIPISLVEGDW